MNNSQLNVYKPIGATSLDMIKLLKKRYPEYSNVKMSYAGRLDPMAHGVLILLVGENENKRRREREKSDKEYIFEIIFGLSTDSCDLLGIPKLHEKIPKEEEIKEGLKDFVGEINQKLPLFSSYRIRGSPMYVLAKNKKISSRDQPSVKREIYSLKYLSSRKISNKELLSEIKERIGKIQKNDFRQEIIIPKYEKLLSDEKDFLICQIHAHVSSGTYIRSICDDLGKKLNTGACAFEIQRTRSGEYKIEDSLRIS